MPNKIEIYLGDQLADYEGSESLPLSLSKKTDKILEIVGADGVEIDNPLESITLPASKNNHSIYDQIALLHEMPGTLLVKDTKCLTNGVTFFSGASFLKKVSVKNYPKEMVLELAGDGLAIWSRLEGISLRDLDLGVQEWTAATCQTSWVATPTTGYSGIFAPVLYGKTSGTGEPGAWHEKDLRLHVYFYTILKGIFETYLGYSLVSDFFETLWFGRWAYVFGIGDLVQYENLPDKCSVHVYRIPGVAGSTDPILYHIEYEDTENEWDEVGQTTFTADPTVGSVDEYTVEFNGQGVNWGTFEIEINGVVVYSTSPSYTVGGAQFFQVIKNFDLNTGDTLTTHAYTDGGGTMFINDVHLRIYTTPKPWQGADIVVSSCLHDEPVKKFIRAVSQMFCLAWRVNNTTKQVFCEPRFPYRLYSSGSYTQYDGFYRAPSDPSTLQTLAATDYDIDFEYPFGKELTMSYAANEADPLFETYEQSSLAGIPIFGIKKPFNADDGKSTDSKNDLFSPLLLSSPDSASAQGGILPTCLPENYEITEEAIPSVDKTFKCKPTCGMVFREAVEAYWDNTSQVETMPFLSQYKPYRIAGDHDDELNSGIFADMTALPVEDGQSSQLMKGLASTFYQQYFECMKPAALVRCENPISLVNFSAEDFRDLKIMNFGNGNVNFGILLEIGNFNPVTMQLVSLLFLKWRPTTADEAENITHNPIEIAPPRPTGICCDASASVEKDGTDATITATACRTIKNVEVLVDNTRAYSGDLTAGSFGNASVDSDGVITIDSAAIGTGVITFTINIKQDGCATMQSVRTIEY